MRKTLTIILLNLLFFFSRGAFAATDIDWGTFEDGSSIWGTWGGTATVVDNPYSGGINTSGKVLRYIPSGNWQGINKWFNGGVLTSDHIKIEMDVYAEANVTIQLWMNNPASSGASGPITKQAPVTSGSWQKISFDITNLTAYDWQNITFQNSATTTIYFDNIVVKAAPPIDPVSEVVISGANYVFMGSSIKLSAKALPASAPQTVTWSVSDETIATITASGVLTGLKLGTVAVRATTTDTSAAGSGKYAEINVNVLPVSASVKSDSTLANFETGLQGFSTWNGTVSVVANPGKDSINSSDSVLYFQQTGWGGAARFNASNRFRNYFTKMEFDVYVTAASTVQVQFDQGAAGTDVTFNIPVSDANANKWVRLSVNLKGLPDDNYRQVWFRLNQAAANWYLDNIVYYLEPGRVLVDSIAIVAGSDIDVDNGTTQMQAEVYPADAYKAIAWSIDNTDIASIDPVNGLLTAIKNGSVKVRATAKDGSGVYAEKTINITNQIFIYVDSIKLMASDTAIRINEGKLQFTVVVYPDSAENKAVVYSVSDPAIATISTTGLLKALKNGVVWVKATSVEGGKVDSMKITIINQHAYSTFAIAKKLDAAGITSDTDYSAIAKTWWDSDSIYVVIEVKDDIISLPSGANPWDIDNIEIYFDMKNGKVPNWPRTSGWPPAYQGMYGYYQLRVSPFADGSPVNTMDQWATLNGSYSGIKVNYLYERVTGGYIFRLSFLTKSLDSTVTLSAGKRIGFDILASDNDTDPAVRNQVSFNSPNTLIYVDAAAWATLECTDEETFVKIDDTEAPSTPANVATTVSGKNVKITWDASTDNIVVHEYIIYNGSAAIDTITAKQTGNSYTVKNLADGTYTFGVQAVDLYGNKSGIAKSGEVVITDVSVPALTAYFNIYPNPVSDVLNIRSSTELTTVAIYNITGQLERMVRVQGKEATINLSDLCSGVYFIRINTAEGVRNSRIIKK